MNLTDFRGERRVSSYARLAVPVVLLACFLDGGSGPNRLPPLIATPDELRALVGVLADDAMRGRRAGTADEDAATTYVASLVEDYGLLSGGTGGGFFHEAPGTWRTVTGATLTAAGGARSYGTDFVATLPRTSSPTLSWDADAVYGGTFLSANDPLPAGLDVTGRAVVLLSGGPVIVSLVPGAPLSQAAVVLLVVDALSPDVVGFAASRRLLAGSALRSIAPAPVVVTVTRSVAEDLMGAPLAGMALGHPGGRATGSIQVTSEAVAMRNVVAILPGSDPAVSDEFVAIGAHLDHLGVGQSDTPTDSIYNGADDNASGSAALLMLARHFADPGRRPRRSLLFIWFAAEELGLIGSEAYSHAPTVPLASMSAFVNLDMISRGGAADIEGGGPGYLESIGSRRRSTQLALIADSVAAAHGMQLDYTLDAPDHPERVFCRSDHWNFARFGVPVVFFSTGVHNEYHTVDDELERSDFSKLARVTTFTAGIVDAIASRAASLARNLPAPDPSAPCQQ